MNNTFAFIGAGNMGGAVVEAVCRVVPPQNVAIYRRTTEKAVELSKKTGCIVASNGEEAVKNAHFVVMCVKPNVFNAVLKQLSPALKECEAKGEKKVIVSIAAGISISDIETVLKSAGIGFPVVRIMPNTPVKIGKGLSLMARGEGVSDEDSQILCHALSSSGMISQVEEKYIDIATPVFSCSPAFVYMFIEAIADGGVKSGLPRAMSQQYAAQAVMGAAEMVLETGEHPGSLKDAVCSPGGSTIAGVEELEKNAFRGTVASAINEAYSKIKD